MPEDLAGRGQAKKGERRNKWLALFVALVLAAVAGRLTMALFWAASAFAFIREHESIHESLLVIGTLVGITVMVVVLVASYRAIKKHMTEAKPT